MKLQEKLDRQKKSFEAMAPKEVVETVHQAINELQDSGILEQTVQVGDEAPEFSLKNADGKEFRSKELLSEGPVVLTFYRGKW